MKKKNRIRIFSLVMTGLLCMLMSSCKKENKLVPVLTTSPVSNISGTTATSGGNIIDDRGLHVIARGVCWSTVITPTIANYKTTDGAGAGSFISSITGLNPGIIYYVRAYATSSSGTGYGMTISFTTSPADVTDLNVINGTSEITFTWKDPLDKNFVKVEISYGDSTFEVLKGIQSKVIKNLVSGKEYTFTIKTVDNNGKKSNGIQIVSFTTLPADVTDLNVINGTSEITLTWKDPLDKNFVKVEISYGDSTCEVLKGIQSKVIKNLVSGEEYTFTIKTVDNNGNKSNGIQIVGNPDYRNKYIGSYKFMTYFWITYWLYYLTPQRDTTISGTIHDTGVIEKYETNKLKIIFKSPYSEPDFGGQNTVYFPIQVDGLVYPTVSDSGTLSYEGISLSYDFGGRFIGSDSVIFIYGLSAHVGAERHTIRGKKLYQ